MHTLANNYVALRHYQTRLLEEYFNYPRIQNEELAYKLRVIYETLLQLRYRLALERQYLEKERWEAQSMYSFPTIQATVPSSGYISRESYYNLEYPYYYPQPEWTLYPPAPYNYEGYPNNPYEAVYCTQEVKQKVPQDPQLVKVYKGHLDDVERMCNEELSNMEMSISNLRKIRKDWNCYEIKGTSGMYQKVKRRVRRKREYYYGDYNN